MPPSRPNASIAQRALSAALAAHGPARIEGLARVTREHADYAPGWIALAEEHLRARRREEALTAARRAMRLDIDARRRFSPELADLVRPVVPERKRDDEAPGVAVPSEEQRSQAIRAGRPAASHAGAQALQQASILVGYHRRTRLEELSREYPDYAPIWIALAEESLAQRNVDVAMDAATHAMQLDPSLEAVMSPPLARAWKYHKKESRRHPAPAAAPAAASPSASPEPGADTPAAPSHEPQGYSKYRSSPPVQRKVNTVVPPMDLAAMTEAAPRHTLAPHLEKMLVTAMGLRSREERITILQQLRAMDPESDEVLFHLAKELALAERAEDARVAGDALRELAPERYVELYAWAEKHWAEKARKAAEPEPARVEPPRVEPPRVEPARVEPARVEPARVEPPRVVPSPLTQVLAGLDAEAQLHEPRPAPRAKRQDANLAPRATTPRPPPEPVPVSPVQGLYEDAEPTVRVSRPPGAMAAADHGKENSAFKTVVMNLNEMQRLADETRSASDPSPPGAPAHGQDHDHTQVEKRPSPMASFMAQHAASNPPTGASDTQPMPSSNRLRQGPPDTRVEVRPRGRLPFIESRPESELEFRPPDRAAAKPDGTGDQVDELIESLIDADRSTTMPPWLSNPRPWAATPGKPSPTAAPRPRSDPTPASPTPASPRAAAPAPAATASPAAAPSAPRAHPRLVRKRPTDGKGPNHSGSS